MTDTETIVGGGGIAAVLGFLRWAVGLWATVRREDIAATTARATADREADVRQVDRQVASIDRIAATVSDHTARDIAAHAEVTHAVVRLEAKVDTAIAWQARERERTAPYAAPDINQDEHPSERRRKTRARSPVGE